MRFTFDVERREKPRVGKYWFESDGPSFSAEFSAVDSTVENFLGMEWKEKCEMIDRMYHVLRIEICSV